MNTSQAGLSLKKLAGLIEWKLLVFLVLFMDVKLAVKFSAVLLIYFLQPDFKFRFRITQSRLPLFYLIVIAVALINYFIYRNYSINYLMVAMTGILFWTACILAVHQVKLFTEKTDIAILHNTLLAFFLLNMLFSAFNFLAIFSDTGLRNPFSYQGQYQKYFMNTGDYIKGLTFDTSTTNAFINCLGIVYFLYRKTYLPLLAGMVVLLMTASNFSNFILLLIFAGLFIFKSTKEQKSVMAICIILMIIFLAKISPQNENYATDILDRFILGKKENHLRPEKMIPLRERPDSLLDTGERKEKTALLYLDSLAAAALPKNAAANPGTAVFALYAPLSRPSLPKDSIHTASFQWKRDTTAIQRRLLSYVERRQSTGLSMQYKKSVPGKIQAFTQSFNFLKEHPVKIITGAGPANFSSKLAFRATGLKIAGSFPEQFVYCNPDFSNNHLNLYTYFFSKHADSHSLIHNPASVYDQLLTEYGLIGILAFPVYYLGYFLKHLKKLTYGIPLLIMLLAFLTVDYWFENLSVIVLFELMMFVNIKEPAIKNADE